MNENVNHQPGISFRALFIFSLFDWILLTCQQSISNADWFIFDKQPSQCILHAFLHDVGFGK